MIGINIPISSHGMMANALECYIVQGGTILKLLLKKSMQLTWLCSRADIYRVER